MDAQMSFVFPAGLGTTVKQARLTDTELLEVIHGDLVGTGDESQ